LRATLRDVKGVGSYAANHLLMLLGITIRSPATAKCGRIWHFAQAPQREVERAAATRYQQWAIHLSGL